jgi:hypothetical protein
MKPTVVPSITKRTAPPGVPVAGASADTSALIVTGWPNTDGLGDVVATVVVCAVSTSWSRLALAPANLASPW